MRSRRPGAGLAGLSNRAGLLLALALAAPVLLAGLGRLPLVDPDEGRYAWAARIMARDGLTLTPTFNDEPRFAKPAPLTWLQALSMRAVGESELGVRLPGALLALAAVGVVFGLAAGLGGPWAGLLAATILATSFRFDVIARQALVDAPLVLAMAGAMASLCRVVTGPEPERARAAAAAHLWMAAGTLCKGPIAIAIPWLSLGVYAVVSRRGLGALRGARIGRALALLALVAAPYFLAMTAVHGSTYLHEVVVRQHFERFRGIRFGQPSQRGFGYFLRVLPGDLAPWTPALAVSLVLLARVWRTLAPERREAYRYLLGFAATVVVFFSFPRFKLPHYLLPAFAPLAVVAGAVLGGPGVGRRAGLAAAVPGALAVAAAAFAGAHYLGTLAMPGGALIATGALALLATGVALVLRLEGRQLVAGLGALTALAYVVLGAEVAPRLGDAYRPERALAAAIPQGARVGLYRHWSSAFVYYAGRRVETVGEDPEALRSFAVAGGRAVVLCADPPPAAVAAVGGRRIARGEVLSPRLEDLWRPRPPGAIGLFEVSP